MVLFRVRTLSISWLKFFSKRAHRNIFYRTVRWLYFLEGANKPCCLAKNKPQIKEGAEWGAESHSKCLRGNLHDKCPLFFTNMCFDFRDVHQPCCTTWNTWISSTLCNIHNLKKNTKKRSFPFPQQNSLEKCYGLEASRHLQQLVPVKTCWSTTSPCWKDICNLELIY